MPEYEDDLAMVDFSKLPPAIKEPDYSELQGPLYEAGLSGAPALDKAPRETIESEIGFPNPRYAEYEANNSEVAPPIESTGVAKVPAAPRPPIDMLPGARISRIGDGCEINAVVLPANVAVQVCQSRPGRTRADIWNPGQTPWGNNPCYFTDSLEKAEAIADGVLPLANGIFMPISNFDGGAASSLTRPFQHESEAPLYAVSPSGTVLSVYDRFYKAISHRTAPGRHNASHLQDNVGSATDKEL